MTDESWVCPVCELPHDADTVKSMITVTEVLDLLGVEVDRNHKFTLRDERTPSVHDFGDHFFDFGTGQGGDVIDLVRELSRTDDGETLSYNKALSMLMHRALRAGREPGAVERQPVREVVDFTEQLGEYAWANDWPGLIGHPPHCRVTGTNDLLIPHERDGLVYGVKVRSLSGSKSAWPGSQFGFSLYHQWGWNAWVESPRVILAEGESDAWALQQAIGFDAEVLALPSGAGTFKKHWLEDLKDFETVWLCFDNDQAGKKALDRWRSELGWLKAKPLRVPQLFNDAREAIAAGWRPELS